MSASKFFTENYFNDDGTWLSSYGMMHNSNLDELDGLTGANTKSNVINVTVNLNSPVLEIEKIASLEHMLSATMNINCIMQVNKSTHNANVHELEQHEQNDSGPRKLKLNSKFYTTAKSKINMVQGQYRYEQAQKIFE